MTGYIVGFIALFVFCGMGKGSVFKLIPSVFQERSHALNVSEAERRHWERVMSGALIGFAGAFGALGAMGINLALRQSYLSTGTETPAFWIFLVCYIGAAILTWVRYVRTQGIRVPIRRRYRQPRRCRSTRDYVNSQPGGTRVQPRGPAAFVRLPNTELVEATHRYAVFRVRGGIDGGFGVRRVLHRK